ncbi:MAG TPA: Uma2 family endonuclease [Longimicrobium sp.]|nr:Uma2 family endonuclease [Longimicrobium sp.]
MSTHALHTPGWISYEDFIASVPDGTRAEWVDGEIIYMSPQSDRHYLISGFLYRVLHGFVLRNGIGGFVGQAGFQVRLGRSGREPDVVYLTPEHRHRFKKTWIEEAVDLAVEIISPDSRLRDRHDKFREYAQAGVAEYWIIDPVAETVEVYRLGGSGAYEPRPLGDPPRIQSEVIPGLWIDPAWLWADEPDDRTAYKAWGLV